MTIWKYSLTLTTEQKLEAPKDSVPLTVQLQDGVICLWMLVEPEREKVWETIYIYGTGNPIDKKDYDISYVGSIQQGPFVRHVFMKNEP